MRLPTVISAGSQPTRRRQRPRLDPAALTRSDGLLPLRCTASWPRPDVRVAHLAGELDTGTTPFRAEYLGEQTATRPAELVLDLSESRWWPPPGRRSTTATGSTAGSTSSG